MGVLAPLFILGAVTTHTTAIFGILYIAIGAIAGLGVFLFERSNQSKAKDFAKSVETNASSAEGLKDPQRIAQMDHMRKEFQRGIDIYKKHGKDLYSLPWYVVVGESESGKTEMLRRSEIGFPDKLQDRWQGSGGTLSMHWWFSNKAVILDTAGRLFVAEGAETGQNQWINFLQMLKRNRPDCPINGLILVIPANRLLTHPDPDLEATSMAKLDENAGQIAKQMETLQNELGVRFPVYILITKMDKMNGFREFFGKIDKPEDRYQIMGWSNPAPLGEPFEPLSVAEYIRSVADRLKRRMMSELRNVEPAENNGLRINEVDGLFAFPAAFESLSNKLTRYLRHIFTTDEWSAKPPFLRGIYFTSALQQGKVLDEALAAAMGVPFDQMDSSRQDDGLSLSKNRTYFVRDLFLDKIFSEKGLVTTSGKIQSKISGWKLWVPALCVVMLALFGLLGWLAMKEGNEATLWNTLWCSGNGSEKSRIRQLVTYDNPQLVPAKAKETDDLLNTLNELGSLVKSPPEFGWVFAPAQWCERDLDKNRQPRYVAAVAEVLTTVDNAIIDKLTELQRSEKAHDWSKDECEAVHALAILHNGTLWNAKKMTLAFKGEEQTAWPIAKLLVAVFHYAKIENNKKSEATFENCIGHALTLPQSTFTQQFRARPGDDAKLKVLIRNIIPPSKLVAQHKFTQDLNEFYDSFNKIKQYEAKAIRDLADKADALLKQGKLVDLTAILGDLAEPAEPAEPTTPAGALSLATDRDALLQAMVGTPEFAKTYGYDAITASEGPKLKASAGAKTLVAKDNLLLKQIKATLDSIKSDDGSTRNSEDLDKLSAPEPPASDLALDKETSKKLLGKLDELKKSWFKEEFFPKQFYRYLLFPIISDETAVSYEKLLTLWKLCKLSKDPSIDFTHVDRLMATFDVFFDTKKLTAIDTNKLTALNISNALRTCTAKVNHPSTLGAKTVYTIESGGEVKVKFDIFAQGAAPPAKPIPLDKPLVFRKDGANDANVAAWGIAKVLKSGERQFTTDKKTTYEIEIVDADLDLLKNWPKRGDFEPKK